MATEGVERGVQFRGILRLIASILDARDPHGHAGTGHAARVAYLAWEIASSLGLDDAGAIFHAGLVHDIGAIGIEEHVSDLALREFGDPTARSHPAIGRYLLGNTRVLEWLAPYVDNHHERIDGHGFPHQRRDGAVPIGASILHAADAIEFHLRTVPRADALESCRALVRSLGGTAVPREVADAAGALLGDPDLLDLLLDGARLAPALDAIAPPAPALDRFSRRDVVTGLLALVGRVVDARHPQRVGHSLCVAAHAFEIARQLGADLVDPWDLAWAGLLHDVAASTMPPHLLGWDPPASPADRALVETHAPRSGEIVARLPGLAHLAPVVAAHHERWDGTGFPLGLAGERIPLLGRVLAYADRYAILVASRGAGSAAAHRDVMTALGEEIGAALDPHLAGAAMSALDRHGPRHRQLASLADSWRELFDPADHAPPAALPDLARAAPVASGALLLDVEPWRRVELSAELAIVDGLDDLVELTGQPPLRRLTDHLAPESGRHVTDACATLGPGDVFSRYLFTTTGRPLEVALQPQPPGFSLLVRSAQNRLASMDRLAHFYRNFLASTEAVVFTDPDGKIIDVNRAFLDLFGYPLREIIGQHTRILSSGHHPRYLYQQLWAGIQDPAVGTWSGELIDRCRDGREIHVHMRINAVRAPNGTCLGYIAHHTDISERKRAEAEILRRDEELRRKSAELERLNQFKTDMVAITSHDLKSPLASIVGLSTVVRRNLARMSRESVGSYLDRIADSARNLTSFINDLLDLEKIESGTLQLDRGRVHLAALLEKCAERAREAAQERVRLVLRADRASTPILADAARLEQIFDNLLANALKFSPEGSTIEVRHDNGGEQARVVIDDEGPGIPPDQVATIFDRYVQVERSGGAARRGYGIGLGLSIVRSLVQLHGGSVWAENRARRGCRFVVELPVHRGDPRVAAPVALIRAAPCAQIAELVDQLAELGVAARRVESSGDLRWYCDVVAPEFVFVCRPFLDVDVLAYLQELHASRVAPPLRVVLDDRLPEPGERSLLDATLSPPVLDEELREVLRLPRGADR